MNTHLTNTAGKIIAGLTALALLGTLGACGKKTDSAQNQTALNVATSAAVSSENSTVAPGDDDTSAEVGKDQGQEKRRRGMRQGRSMMPDFGPSTDTPQNSQAAPAKDK
ncbi:MAG: hypothetical protein ACOY4B_03075 [Pseudomonadota bacterium]